MISTSSKSDPVRVIVTFTDEDAEVCNRLTRGFQRMTGLTCDPETITKYIMMRSIDRMAVNEGVLDGGEPESKAVVKITLDAQDLVLIDDYRKTIADQTGVDIQRWQAVKALIRNGAKTMLYNH